jgi:hypothetical protein
MGGFELPRKRKNDQRKSRVESRIRTEGKIKAHEDKGGFIYWRDQPQILHVPYGWLTRYQLETKKIRFIEQTDTITDKKWWVRQDPGSHMIHTKKPQTSFLDSEGNKIYVHEDRYTEEQYDLIRVAVWYMIVKEWKARWVYELLTHPDVGFPQLPGQTPLTARKVHVWKMVYRAYLSRGLLWP